MLSNYRRVLATPGSLLFSATGLVARLPISMLGIGIVLLVSSSTGSYAVAGRVAAAYVVANAIFSIIQGRLVDTFGQARVLPVGASAFAVGLGLLMAGVQLDWPRWLVFVAAFVAGASLPPVGACIRARWRHVLDEPGQVHTAFALEAVVDEAVFITGPVVVALLATLVHPLAGLLVALLVGTWGPWFLATQRATEPPSRRGVATRTQAPMPWVAVAALTLVMMCLGTLFGAAEVVTIAFTEERDATSWSGPLLAVWALGSLVAGVVVGAVHWRRGPADRLVVGAAGMAAAMCVLPYVSSLPGMVLALLVGGLAISPTLIAGMSLAEQVSPPSRLTESLGLLHTGMAAGVALGAAAGGAVIDASGASAAYWVPAVGGLAAVLFAGLTRLAVRTPARVEVST